MSAENLGKIVRRWRLRRRLTQRELADLAAISVRALRDIETGRVDSPRQETVELLSGALRLDRSAEAGLFAAALAETPEAATELSRPPVAASGIIGRDEETRVIVERLLNDGQRLVTVTGLPGVGKTRLVLEAARWMDVSMEVPVRWLSAGQSNPLWHEPGEAGPRRPHLPVVEDQIGDQRLVLVVDGLDGFSESQAWLAELLRACPRLGVLSSSRAPLGVPGEWVLPLVPLAVPPASGPCEVRAVRQCPSVRVLLSHVLQVRSTFRLQPDNAADIARLCRCLDGLPLALELAAPSFLLQSAAELARLAGEDPFALPSLAAEPRLRDALVGGLTAVREDDDLLQALVKLDGEWTISEAADRTGADPAAVTVGAQRILKQGLVRVVSGWDTPRFAVLNLVNALL
ncbi:helix-turn-helix domain-containing protein [[Actinomadura] parvosata]|uniref:helix-turn-helix domain-containing protein n=1 Tax=[Actinomadura] parvosata TaxID=1955412 RepID=UPI00406D2003